MSEKSFSYSHAGDVLNFIRLSEKIIACFVLLASVAMVLFICLSSYTEKVQLAGWVFPEQGLIEVKAEKGGYVTKVFTKTEELLNKGQALYQISDTPITSSSIEKTTVIYSTANGSIGRLNLSVNQFLNVGATAAVIIPDNPSWMIKLKASSKDVGKIHKGDLVFLNYHAYPSQRYGTKTARVVAVDKAPESMPENESFYGIYVRPDQQCIDSKKICHDLIAGMRVSAIIETDRRSLFSWLFKPLM